MAKKLTNSGQTKRGVLDRFLSLHAEQDRIKEDLKELATEIKSREADLGFTVKQCRAAVALYRKGAQEKQGEVARTVEFLLEAGLIEAAADEALS